MRLINHLPKLLWQFLLLQKRKTLHKNYSKHYRNYLKLGGGDFNTPAKGEDEYIRLWSKFGAKVEPYSYRYFSQYMGNNPCIIPEDIGHSYIEYHLNPIGYTKFYADKNVYNFLFGDKVRMPKTILRRIARGAIMNDKYEVADLTNPFDNLEFDTLVLKPTIDSSSGNSVVLFTKHNNQYITNINKVDAVLSPTLLEQYGSDWILQEGIKQHEIIGFFNSSSVNTLRVCTYRSVVDESIRVSCCGLRIGKKNSVVDNLHAGGVVAKIELEDGKIANKVLDQFGKTYTEWNGVDFTNIDMKIPSWEKVVEFAKTVAKHYLHCRLLALDISINVNGDPVLIEVNNESFGFWFPMLINYNVFCDETEEVIDYCVKRESEKKSFKIQLV